MITNYNNFQKVGLYITFKMLYQKIKLAHKSIKQITTFKKYLNKNTLQNIFRLTLKSSKNV